MAHGLPGLCLSLSRHGAGVDDHRLGLFLGRDRKAGAGELVGNEVRLDAIDAAAKVHVGNGGEASVGALLTGSARSSTPHGVRVPGAHLRPPLPRERGLLPAAESGL